MGFITLLGLRLLMIPVISTWLGSPGPDLVGLSALPVPGLSRAPGLPSLRGSCLFLLLGTLNYSCPWSSSETQVGGQVQVCRENKAG